MKKRIFILLFLLIFMALSGCMYKDTRKKYMDLVEIHVFDENNNELHGEYENYFGKFNFMQFKKCNSAAPVCNVLNIKIKESKNYTVKFYFKSNKFYKMKELVLTNELSHYADETNITTIKEIDEIKSGYVVTFNTSAITEKNNKFIIKQWIDNNDKVHVFSTKGSNSYIKGVVFNFE
ncbi:MAG: hypothetical protein SOU07_03245 [Bacilli bacterium]|nr:hypothetical protein [Acholeplasmataceae bacterium]MDY2902438.1 hypothetical protein [Bacilli bacterium]